MKKRFFGAFLIILGFTSLPISTNKTQTTDIPIPSEQTEVFTEEVVQVSTNEDSEESGRDLIFYCDTIDPLYDARQFTFEDAQMLMRIAEAEAGNQGVEGMKLVMIVVLNRVNSESFPDTIEGVIFQPHQFQPVSDGRYYTVEISTEAHLALAAIETGEPIDESIIAFEATSNKSLEKYFKYAYTVGGHDFYTAKGETK